MSDDSEVPRSFIHPPFILISYTHYRTILRYVLPFSSCVTNRQGLRTIMCWFSAEFKPVQLIEAK